MPGLKDRLLTLEAGIAAVAAFVAAMGKYVAITKVLPLPAVLLGFPAWLSTFVMVILVLVLLIMSGWILARKSAHLSIAIVVMALGGVGAAVGFATEIQSGTVEAECSDGSTLILKPKAPSANLASRIEIAGGLPDAWCDADDKENLRQEIRAETAEETGRYTAWLIAAEALLAAALLLAGWVAWSDDRARSGNQ